MNEKAITRVTAQSVPPNCSLRTDAATLAWGVFVDSQARQRTSASFPPNNPMTAPLDPTDTELGMKMTDKVEDPIADVK